MKSFSYAVLIASDSRSQGEREDLCTAAIEESLGQGFELIYKKVIPDEAELITGELLKICDELGADLVITSGGTGFSPRDNTPEASLAVIERNTPGLSEAIRLIALKKTPYGMLSRAVSGIRGKSLIVNLPGSPRAVKESIEGVREALIHGLEVLLGHQGEHK